MEKDPAFLFYFRDFLVSTALMTPGEVGSYTRILCHMADKGPLSLFQLKQIAEEGTLTQDVLNRLKQDPHGNYFSEKLFKVMDKRQNFRISRINNLNGVPHFAKGEKPKKVKTFIAPTLEQVIEYAKERGNKVDPQYFFDKNDGIGWVDKNGNKYKNWKAVYRVWESYAQTNKVAPSAPVKRPVKFVVLEMIAAGRTNHEIKHELVGKYIEKDIDEAIMDARGKRV